MLPCLITTSSSLTLDSATFAAAFYKQLDVQVIHYDIKSSNVLLDNLTKHVVRPSSISLAWPSLAVRETLQQALHAPNLLTCSEV